MVAGGLAGLGRVGGEDGGALREHEMDAAAKADGEAEIGAGGEDDRAAAGCDSGLDGGVDRGGVERLAVARGAEGTDVEEGLWSGVAGVRNGGEAGGGSTDETHGGA